MSKSNNNRKYPAANHQPFHMANLRKEDALLRQAAYDELSLEEKIARLPPEPHAKKQRNRLLSLLERRNAPKPKLTVVKADDLQVEVPAKTKRYMREQK